MALNDKNKCSVGTKGKFTPAAFALKQSQQVKRLDFWLKGLN